MNCPELEYYVGLSDLANPCFGDSVPVDFNKSLSGYFLTDYEDGIPLLEQVNAARTKVDTNVWQILTKARKQAVNDFLTDLTSQIQNSKNSRFTTYKGLIGKGNAGNISNINQSFVGKELRPGNFKGTYLKVEKIGIALDTTISDLNLNILTLHNQEVVETKSTIVNSNAGMVHFTETEDLELPLFGNQNLTYKLIFEVPPNVNVLNSKLSCCGISPDWKKYLDVKGIESSDNQGSTSKYQSQSLGITLDVLLQCKNLEWLCELSDIEGFNLLKVIGKCLQWKGAAKVISAILDSGNINRFTMLNRESLYGKRNHFNKRYFETIEWISENIPSNLTDCYSCKEKRKFHKRQILV